MEKISDEAVCFVASLKEVKKYGLSAAGQLRKNPEADLLFSREGKRNVGKRFIE